MRFIKIEFAFLINIFLLCSDRLGCDKANTLKNWQKTAGKKTVFCFFDVRKWHFVVVRAIILYTKTLANTKIKKKLVDNLKAKCSGGSLKDKFSYIMVMKCKLKLKLALGGLWRMCPVFVCVFVVNWRIIRYHFRWFNALIIRAIEGNLTLGQETWLKFKAALRFPKSEC